MVLGLRIEVHGAAFEVTFHHLATWQFRDLRLIFGVSVCGLVVGGWGVCTCAETTRLVADHQKWSQQ